MTRKFFGCRILQRGTGGGCAFFMFHATAKDVKQWATVKRTAETPEGTQRLLRLSRVRAISRFLTVDPRNVVPNSVLLCFPPDKADYQPVCTPTGTNGEPLDWANHVSADRATWGYITFDFDPDAPETERPALIVDGQHRLFGLSAVAEELPIVVIALLEASVEEQAFQFIVINNKAVRVPTDNVKAIIALQDEGSLKERLLTAGVRYGNVSPILREVDTFDQSPFQSLLDWPYNREGQHVVSVTAIEQSLRFVRAEFPSMSEDDDSVLGFFFAMWRAIAANFASLWGLEGKFMSKVNLNAVNEFVVHRLKIAWEYGIVDVFDPPSVERQALNTIKPFPAALWESEWSVPLQDNATVRTLIVQTLERIIDNTKLSRPWSDDLKLIPGDEVKSGEPV